MKEIINIRRVTVIALTFIVAILIVKGKVIGGFVHSGGIDYANYIKLRDAVGSGNTRIIQELYDSGIAIDGRVDNFDSTALHLAVEEGKINVVYKLISLVADINNHRFAWNGNHDAYTPLMIAAEKGNLLAAKALITNKADLNIGNDLGYTALILAVGQSQTEFVRLLLNNGANIGSKTIVGRTALISATESGNMELVDLLISSGADTNAAEVFYRAPEPNRSTALIIALKKNYFEIAKRLITAGADVKRDIEAMKAKESEDLLFKLKYIGVNVE